ncbi:MAG: DUF6443 domain-containing protein, partial [Cyclobacteriaceae bacterium]
MKKYIISIIGILVCSICAAQSQDENYVHTYTARQEISTDLEAQTDPAKVLHTIEYLDGLGRPIQQVIKKGSPNEKDILTISVYDGYGRSLKQYLPFLRQTVNEGLEDDPVSLQETFYDNHFTAGKGHYALSQTEVEHSPLARPLKQSAPGKSWRISGNHTIEMAYRVNEVDDNIMNLTVIGDQIVSEGFYPAGSLSVEVITDENTGISEGETRTFVDKSGRMLVKKVKLSETEYLSTYYLYDDYNNLRYVLQPEGVEEMNNVSDLNTGTFRENWMFSYEYDARNRMIAKRVPGSAKTYMVYDQRDRLILLSDGNLREGDKREVSGKVLVDRYEGKDYHVGQQGELRLTKGFSFKYEGEKTFKASLSDFSKTAKWIFTKYDEQNRPVATGFYYDDRSRETLQSMADVALVINESYTGSGVIEGYSNNAFPTAVDTEDLLSITYYDRYGFLNNGTTGIAKGLVTGAKTRIPGTDQWLVTSTFYDDRYRPVRIVSDNHKGGTDQVETYYKDDVSSLVTQTVSTHTSDSYIGSLVVTDNFTYDHMDRLLSHSQSINGGTPVIIATNTYNDLGELSSKQVGGNVQTVDYEYNMRGWLTKINGGASLTGSDKFGMELQYDAAGQYNGNIGKMLWQSQGGTNTNVSAQAFDYTYDRLSRLTSASYFSAGKNGHFDVANITYDGNGNILSLNRNWDGGALDRLTYAYIGLGNQLTNVSDGGNKAEGFLDHYADIGEEYHYDANGNMV